MVPRRPTAPNVADGLGNRSAAIEPVNEGPKAFRFLGRSKDASAPGGAVICFSFFTMVLLVLLPGETGPTWAYPVRYTPALAFSALSMLLLLTRLAVRSAQREPGKLAAFPCSTTITEG